MLGQMQSIPNKPRQPKGEATTQDKLGQNRLQWTVLGHDHDGIKQTEIECSFKQYSQE